ncbi:MAG: hypothetical protein M2R45_02681 [Verrucomicrobia subdivision 3 bacterium]|nr:hypothetical protein [Limisphaerales bacterium]MCS1414057.1 hypothetical protein [Limisphaerales bacterium]
MAATITLTVSLGGDALNDACASCEDALSNKRD